MDRPTRIAGLATAALLALAVSSCAPVRINSYLERGVDFQQYRTYAWGPADGLSTGVFILGPERGMALVERLPDVEAVIVTADNQVRISSGLQGRVTIRHPPTP